MPLGVGIHRAPNAEKTFSAPDPLIYNDQGNNFKPPLQRLDIGSRAMSDFGCEKFLLGLLKLPRPGLLARSEILHVLRVLHPVPERPLVRLAG